MKSDKPNSFAYLESLNVDKMRFGLKAIRELLLRLGNPQKSYRTIIIAGTNGKGSTAAMTASILRSAGYSVGLYTSPHLIDVRERIVVGGRKISIKYFNRTIADVRNQVKQAVSYFEFLTAVALVYFQKQKVDIAVLEVGLGGRLDATNICKPFVSVITNINFDHTAYLGDTLESIAREKAGIIKQNDLCLTAAKQKKVLRVLEEVCLNRRATLCVLGRDMKIKKQKDGSFHYYGLNRHLKNLTIPLRGGHQLFNAALALAAVEIGEKKGLVVGTEVIYRGLENTRWEGRLEVLQQHPLFLLDGAHNPAGIDTLCRSLKKDFAFRRLIIIFGALADKDYQKMLGTLCPLAWKIIVTQINARRAVPVNELKATAHETGCSVVMTGNVRQAVKQALVLAGQEDLICATGSFYLAGEIKQAFPKTSLCDNENKQRKSAVKIKKK